MNSLTKQGKFIVFGGLAIIVVFITGVYWWQRGDALLVQPPFKQDAKLYENCAKAEIPQTELDTTLDVEGHTATIRWRDGNRQEDIELKLPYYPETGFAGCSESTKSVLRHIQEAVVFP